MLSMLKLLGVFTIHRHPEIHYQRRNQFLKRLPLRLNTIWNRRIDNICKKLMANKAIKDFVPADNKPVNNVVPYTTFFTNWYIRKGAIAVRCNRKKRYQQNNKEFLKISISIFVCVCVHTLNINECVDDGPILIKLK